MIGLIKDTDTINGWFLFDNGAANASQDELLINQTIYEQLSHIHGDLGQEMFISFLVPIFSISLGAEITFGLRTKFDEMDPSVKRLEVKLGSWSSRELTVRFFLYCSSTLLLYP